MQAFKFVCNYRLRLASDTRSALVFRSFFSKRAEVLLEELDVFLQRVKFRLCCDKHLIIHSHNVVYFFNLGLINCPKNQNCFTRRFKWCFPIHMVEIIENSKRFQYMYDLILQKKRIDYPIFCYHYSESVLMQLHRECWTTQGICETRHTIFF